MPASLSFPALISDVSRAMTAGVTDFCRVCVFSRLQSLTSESSFPKESISGVGYNGRCLLLVTMKRSLVSSLLCVF